jgi:hypothetical protein
MDMLRGPNDDTMNEYLDIGSVANTLVGPLKSLMIHL